MRRTITIATFIAAGLVTGYLALGGAANKPVSAAPAAEAGARQTLDVYRRMGRTTVPRSRYKLAYQHQLVLGDKVIDRSELLAELTVEPLSQASRIELTLSDVTSLSGSLELPQNELLAPFQIGTSGPLLSRIGFEDATTPTARDVLSLIATTSWYSDGRGDSWTHQEEDMIGRFEATYSRDGDEVLRTRHFTAMRQDTGFDTQAAETTVVDGESRYELDDDGLVSLSTVETQFMSFGPSQGIEAIFEITLTRIAVEQVTPRQGAALVLGPLRRHATADSSEFDASLIAGWTTETLIAEFAKLGEFAKGSEEEMRFRGGLLTHMRAMLREDEEAAGDIADAIRANSGDDPREVSIMTGALAAAGTPEATAALVDLVDADLTRHGRLNVVASLGTTSAPSEDSMNALRRSLTDSDVGGTSALALGSQIRILGNEEASTQFIEELIARCESPSTAYEQRNCLNALGNSGDARALPTIKAIMNGASSFSVVALAIYSLRFIEGEEVDAALTELLASDAPAALKVEVVRAAEYRTRQYWEPMLVAALESQPGEELEGAINSVLATWGVSGV